MIRITVDLLAFFWRRHQILNCRVSVRKKERIMRALTSSMMPSPKPMLSTSPRPVQTTLACASMSGNSQAIMTACSSSMSTFAPSPPSPYCNGCCKYAALLAASSGLPAFLSRAPNNSSARTPTQQKRATFWCPQRPGSYLLNTIYRDPLGPYRPFQQPRAPALSVLCFAQSIISRKTLSGAQAEHPIPYLISWAANKPGVEAPKSKYI